MCPERELAVAVVRCSSTRRQHKWNMLRRWRWGAKAQPPQQIYGMTRGENTRGNIVRSIPFNSERPKRKDSMNHWQGIASPRFVGCDRKSVMEKTEVSPAVGELAPSVPWSANYLRPCSLQAIESLNETGIDG